MLEKLGALMQDCILSSLLLFTLETDVTVYSENVS